MPVQRREAVGAGLQSGVASGEHSHTHTFFCIYIFDKDHRNRHTEASLAAC